MLLLLLKLMKIALVAVAVSIPCLALADTGPISTASNPLPPQPTEELKVMTERLNLSRSQQEDIAPILVAESIKRKSIQDDTTLNSQQKHDEIGMVHRSALQQIKALFTPAQMALIESGQNNPAPGPTNPTAAK